MVSKDDIITFSISKETRNVCLKNSKLCNICGISYVPVEGHEMKPEEKRKSKEYKKNNLEYQFVGQLATCVASEWLFRDGTKSYKEEREERNKKPYDGDGGIDLPPYNIDVKGSRMRNKNRDPLDYNFPLRPVERHEGIQYIFSLVSFSDEFENCKAYLMGWIGENEITNRVQTRGVFEGAYLTPIRDLNPMPSLKLDKGEKIKKLNLKSVKVGGVHA